MNTRRKYSGLHLRSGKKNKSRNAGVIFPEDLDHWFAKSANVKQKNKQSALLHNQESAPNVRLRNHKKRNGHLTCSGSGGTHTAHRMSSVEKSTVHRKYSNFPLKTAKKEIKLLCEGINFDSDMQLSETLQETPATYMKELCPGVKSESMKTVHEAALDNDVPQNDENNDPNTQKIETHRLQKKIPKKVRFNLSDASHVPQSVLGYDNVGEECPDITEQIEEETRCFQNWLNLGTDYLDGDEEDNDESFPLTQNIRRCSPLPLMANDCDLDLGLF